MPSQPARKTFRPLVGEKLELGTGVNIYVISTEFKLVIIRGL